MVVLEEPVGQSERGQPLQVGNVDAPSVLTKENAR